MTQTTLQLTKRTKQEIIDEYEKLQSQIEELQNASKIVYSQPAIEVVEKAKEKTPQTIEKAFADFQSSLHSSIAGLRSSLLDQATNLEDLQKAIALSRQQLQIQRSISIAADSLEQLVEEHEKKDAFLTSEAERKQREFDEQMALKKKTWEREIEEYEYQKKMKGERDRAEVEEREKIISAREAAIHEQEQEIAQLKKTADQFPHELESGLTKREQEVRNRLSQDFAHEKTLLEREASARIQLLELTVKNLEERLAAQSQEISSIRQQAEEANTKAQQLAVKAIERPTTIVAPSVQSPGQQLPYGDRHQGNGRRE